MAVDTEKRNKRQNEFIKNAYDRVNLTLPKGKKEEYQARAEMQGLSLNAYINKLLEADAKSPV